VTEADTASTPDAPETTESTDTGPTVESLQAELDKWKAQARKHETRAKENSGAAKELEALRASAMSETEKAVAQARSEGLTEGLRTAGVKLVEANVREAAKGRGVDVDSLVEGIDASKFLDDTGEPDRDAITAWVDKVAPQPTEDDTPPGFPDLGQGYRQDTPALGSDALVDALKRVVGAE
jgi:hypothetical protein